MNYKRTINSCFVGFIVQAIVNNFAPLLFLYFQNSYEIQLSQITALITVNFCVQLTVDLICIKFVDKIGYRAAVVAAHIFSAAGLIMMTFLPDILPSAFGGLLASVVVYAIGGGLIEVVVNPIVEACPTDNKEMTMSMLHSFYCWGSLAVVVISSLFFTFFGISNWRIIALLWAMVPAVNALVLTKVPIAHLIQEGEKSLNLRELFSSRIFWVMLIIMVCSGASELSVSQWASTFAEEALHVSKSVGDLAGPALFAILMGIARTGYGKFGDRINLDRFMALSAALSIISFLLMGLTNNALVGFIGCGLAGFSVGIMWPGTCSLAANTIRGGGTAMFALLALAGDLGCSGGPTLVGLASDLLGGNLSRGLLFGAVFPTVLLISLMVKRIIVKKEEAF